MPHLPGADAPGRIVNTLVILNPAAGRGLGRRLRPRLERALRAAGLAFDLAETEGPGHATALARRAADDGAAHVVVAGGDGALHEAANGLLAAAPAADGASRAALGCLPIGTGNDFAKILGMHRASVEEAAARLARAQTRIFDAGRALGEYFTNSIGIGFDAEAARQANRIRRLRGFAVYVAAVYKTFVTFEASVLEITAEEHRETGPMMMAEVAIGVCAGGGFYITPNADPADGLFDVCLVRKVGFLRFLTKVPRVMKGTHATLDEVTMFRTRRVRIRCAERPLVVQLDGEVREPGLHELEVTIEPARLRVLVA